MNIEEQFQQNYRNANDFLIIFERLLAREKFDLETTDISFLFIVIAENLLLDKSGYFDGATGLITKIRKTRQIEFNGKMWVGDNKTQWLEPFSALVTDKRITKQGIWIKIQVGDDKAEGDLSDAFYLPVETEEELRVAIQEVTEGNNVVKSIPDEQIN
jgi:hypothetical protein